jgi:hypothetical protein
MAPDEVTPVAPPAVPPSPPLLHAVSVENIKKAIETCTNLLLNMG